MIKHEKLFQPGGGQLSLGSSCSVLSNDSNRLIYEAACEIYKATQKKRAANCYIWDSGTSEPEQGLLGKKKQLL